MLEVGILKGFDSGTHTAEVQLVSSTSTYFDAVPVARNIAAGEMVAGRHVILALPRHNPRDAVIIAVFTP
ncbi:MAG: hypothetical protein ACLFVD_02705 [Dehalococcoidia bacterium]